MRQSGDHRCRSGRKCVNRAGKEPAATAKPDTLCQACITDIQACRDKLHDAALAVSACLQVGQRFGYDGDVVSGSKEPPVPLNLSAADLVNEIDAVQVRVGAYLIRDLVSQPGRVFDCWVGGVQQRQVWDGVDLALQVRDVYGKAMGIAGLGPAWQRRQAPCRECRMPCLGQLSGSEVVQCSNCGNCLSEVEYRDYCVELVRGRC